MADPFCFERLRSFAGSARPWASLVVLCVGVTSASAAAQEPSTRIYFGEPAKRCEWATTVSLPSCTGTLIHPQVVIYAAHCKTPRKVRFSENAFFVGELEVPVAYCEHSPDYEGVDDLQKGVDYAYCVLKDPVPQDIPIAPIIYGCELEALSKGTPVWIAGFGAHNHPSAVSGAKVYAQTTFVEELLDGKEFFLGGDSGSPCNGDSGGPAFVQLADKSWRTMGITSCGDRSCEKGAVYTNPATMVPWMHASMKKRGYDIDVEPCFDDLGNWDPSPACGHFATELGKGFGSWNNFCSEGASYSGASMTCGKPHPDAGKPQLPEPSTTGGGSDEPGDEDSSGKDEGSPESSDKSGASDDASSQESDGSDASDNTDDGASGGADTPDGSDNTDDGSSGGADTPDASDNTDDASPESSDKSEESDDAFPIPSDCQVNAPRAPSALWLVAALPWMMRRRRL